MKFNEKSKYSSLEIWITYFDILHRFSSVRELYLAISPAVNSCTFFQGFGHRLWRSTFIISTCTSHETKICYFWEPHVFWKNKYFIAYLAALLIYNMNMPLTLVKMSPNILFSHIWDQLFNRITAFRNVYIWYHQRKCPVFSSCNFHCHTQWFIFLAYRYIYLLCTWVELKDPHHSWGPYQKI